MDLRHVDYRRFEGSYRDMPVRIWGQHEDRGFKRIRRWWNVEAAGLTRTGITDFADAKWVAQRLIDYEIDGDAWESYRRRERWAYEEPHESAPAQGQSTEEEKKKERREKLRQMTVERGCTEAEAAAAKKKLETL